MFSHYVAVTREEGDGEPTSCPLLLIAATRARVTLYILRNYLSSICIRCFMRNNVLIRVTRVDNCSREATSVFLRNPDKADNVEAWHVPQWPTRIVHQISVVKR